MTKQALEAKMNEIMDRLMTDTSITRKQWAALMGQIREIQKQLLAA